jgi:hypothetical protein
MDLHPYDTIRHDITRHDTSMDFSTVGTTLSLPWNMWIAMDYAFVAYHTN